ncbi:MAG: hypothetical protein ACOCYZ_03195 [Halococcoides sp.]
MVEADPVMRGARNGFLVTVVCLSAIGAVQFATSGAVTRPVLVTWVLAVLTYYASRYYYRSTDPKRDA